MLYNISREEININTNIVLDCEIGKISHNPYQMLLELMKCSGKQMHGYSMLLEACKGEREVYIV